MISLIFQVSKGQIHRSRVKMWLWGSGDRGWWRQSKLARMWVSGKIASLHVPTLRFLFPILHPTPGIQGQQTLEVTYCCSTSRRDPGLLKSPLRPQQAWTNLGAPSVAGTSTRLCGVAAGVDTYLLSLPIAFLKLPPDQCHTHCKQTVERASKAFEEPHPSVFLLQKIIRLNTSVIHIH